MDKIILIIVLVLLCIVLIAALKKKNIIDIFHAISKKKIPKINFDLAGTKQARGKTIVLPDLFMYQLNGDGTYSDMFEIYKRDMVKNGQLVGVSISHPGADSDGIILSGRQAKRGSFDENDPATRAALTVPTRAVVIGYDDNGLYGEVTNQKARVYSAYVEGDKTHTKYIPLGETFDIEDGSYLLIGEQWLYFELPKPVQFPGMTSASNTRADDDIVSPPVPPNAGQAPHTGMHNRKSKDTGAAKTRVSPVTNASPQPAARPAATRPVAKTAKRSGDDSASEDKENIRYRFPLEE